MQNMTIGQRIKERRKELGLSQEELAKRLGNKSRASVCTVEKDKEDMTTTRIRQYADALGVTPAYLMGWETQADYTVNVDGLAEEITILSKNYDSKQIERAVHFANAFLKASPERQDIALDILKSHQEDS